MLYKVWREQKEQNPLLLRLRFHSLATADPHMQLSLLLQGPPPKGPGACPAFPGQPAIAISPSPSPGDSLIHSSTLGLSLHPTCSLIPYFFLPVRVNCSVSNSMLVIPLLNTYFIPPWVQVGQCLVVLSSWPASLLRTLRSPCSLQHCARHSARLLMLSLIWYLAVTCQAPSRPLI